MTRWYREHWHPWGKVVGYNEVATVAAAGRGRTVRRFFTPAGRVKFYVPSGPTDGLGGLYRFKTLRACVAFLERHYSAE